jgi:hypothetical protein
MARTTTTYVVAVGALMWHIDSGEVEPFVQGSLCILEILEPNRAKRVRELLALIPPDMSAPNRRHATLRACHDAGVLTFVRTVYKEQE